MEARLIAAPTPRVIRISLLCSKPVCKCNLPQTSRAWTTVKLRHELQQSSPGVDLQIPAKCPPKYPRTPPTNIVGDAHQHTGFSPIFKRFLKLPQTANPA